MATRMFAVSKVGILMQKLSLEPRRITVGMSVSMQMEVVPQQALQSAFYGRAIEHLNIELTLW